MKRFCCVLTLLLFGCSASAGTLVVDGQNPAAADTNAGSPDKPFKTIQAA
jgi:hypothetical protein